MFFSCLKVSVNQVMAYLRHMFPNARHVALSNCIACELHVTLTQHPTNITYMRQHIHTLELISADYFNFPRLVSYFCSYLKYNCYNLAIPNRKNVLRHILILSNRFIHVLIWKAFTSKSRQMTYSTLTLKMYPFCTETRCRSST